MSRRFRSVGQCVDLICPRRSARQAPRPDPTDRVHGACRPCGTAWVEGRHTVARCHTVTPSRCRCGRYKTGVWRGKKMPGNMGNKTVSMKSMLVYQIDP